MFSISTGTRISSALNQPRRVKDKFDTNYMIGSKEHQEFDIGDSKWFGDILFTYSFDDSKNWVEARTSFSDDTRKISKDSNWMRIEYCRDSSNPQGIRSFQLTETHQLESDKFPWNFTIKNTSSLLDFGIL